MRSRPSLPLFERRPPPSYSRRRRRRPMLIAGTLGLVFLALAAVLDGIVRPAPRVVWNASASAPVGLWRIHPGAAIRTGDMVLARTPDAVREFAAERRYLPANVPLLKRVVARDGDEVCALGPAIFVNGRLIAERRTADRQGRPLPWWSGCERLHGDRLFLLMEASDSFDGRYFGPIEGDAIIGKATALWLR